MPAAVRAVRRVWITAPPAAALWRVVALLDGTPEAAAWLVCSLLAVCVVPLTLIRIKEQRERLLFLHL